MKPSSRDLAGLPSIAGLRSLCQSLAMLDAILSPDWESRYYSFDAHWDEEREMASMRNGSGDDYFMQWSSAGAIIKGFSHESVMSPYRHKPPRLWPGVLNEVPSQFESFLSDVAISRDDTTFCLWRTPDNIEWQRENIKFPAGDDPDGSGDLLGIFDGNPRSYHCWAQEYYERSIPLWAVIAVYEHKPLGQELVTLLNPNLKLNDVVDDARQIGY